MATHTPQHAFFAGTSACILQSGKITKWGKPSEIITEENINKAFSTEIKIIIDKDGTKACVPAIEKQSGKNHKSQSENTPILQKSNCKTGKNIKAKSCNNVNKQT